MNNERLVFVGTPEFAATALAGLLEANYQVVAVITQPDKKVGRKQILTASPVKRLAIEHEVPVLQPEKINSSEFLTELRKYQPDLIITAAYGQIFRQELLGLPRLGCINLHGSLLPRWRGASPIQRAIMAGDQKTGISLMQMDKGCDTGAVYTMQELLIEPNETADELFERMAVLARDILLKNLPAILRSELEPKPQTPEEDACYAQMLKKEETEIDWHLTAESIHNQIRGLNSWPVATSTYAGKRWKIWRSRVVEVDVSELPANIKPGMIIANKKRLLVKAGDTISESTPCPCIQLEEIQPAGKSKLVASEVAHAYPVGSCFE